MGRLSPALSSPGDCSARDALWGGRADGVAPAGAETDGAGGRAAGVLELERSPVEEAGHEEEEGAEDEELGSVVEEGEEAAVALSAESDLPWLPVRRAGSGEALQPGEGGTSEPGGPEESGPRCR